MRFTDAQARLHVDFSRSAIETLAANQQLRFWHAERGGVLLASSVGALDGVVVVAHATPPHPDDRAGRTWLKLDHTRVRSEIDAGFTKGLHFVGYWHSHPEVHPRLSTQDVAALLPTLQASDLDLLRIVMVVIGGRRGSLTADVCVVDRRTGAIEHLKLHPGTSSPSPSRLETSS